VTFELAQETSRCLYFFLISPPHRNHRNIASPQRLLTSFAMNSAG
jgi:hypothetical protein